MNPLLKSLASGLTAAYLSLTPSQAYSTSMPYGIPYKMPFELPFEIKKPEPQIEINNFPLEIIIDVPEVPLHIRMPAKKLEQK